MQYSIYVNGNDSTSDSYWSYNRHLQNNMFKSISIHEHMSYILYNYSVGPSPVKPVLTVKNPDCLTTAKKS